MLPSHAERALRVLERLFVVAVQPVELADVVDRARDAALVARLFEETKRGAQVLRGFVEAARVAIEAPDAPVRGAAARSQVESIRDGEHLAKRDERLVVAPEQLQHVAVVVERGDARAQRRLSAPPAASSRPRL